MKKDDLIGQMVQETFNLTENILPFKPVETPSCVEMFYCEERQCYIAHNGSTGIEFPKNWGPFQNVTNNELTISKTQDIEGLIKIFNDFYGTDIDCVRITINKLPSSSFWNTAS